MILYLVLSSCSKPTNVDPDWKPVDISDIYFIASDPDGNLKEVFIRDSIDAYGDSVSVFREIGISFNWDLEVIFGQSPWQARYFRLDSDEKTAKFFFPGRRVIGSGWYAGANEIEINDIVDEISIHAWYIWAAFFGLPWDQEDWRVEFDMITPDLDVYGYEGVFGGSSTIVIEATSDMVDCYKLDIDGRGLIGLFAPDIKLYVRKEPPHIPIYCTIEGEGAVFEFYADSL